jgi:uncharacterized membrane protein
MRWATRVRALELMRGSFWVFSVPGLALGVLSGALFIRLDRHYHWRLLELTAGGAQAFLGSSVATLISLLGIAFSVVVLIVQLSAAQLSPRAVKPALGGVYAKAILTLTVFALGYVLAALLSSGKEEAPQLSVLLSIPLVVGSIIGFVGFLDRVGRHTRHAYVIETLVRATAESIARVYPLARGERAPPCAEERATPGSPAAIVRYDGREGFVQAYHLQSLARQAERLGVHLQIVHGVGEYLYPGCELFRVLGAEAAAFQAEVRDSVVVGAERSLSDPLYGFRLLVDIAIKALSPAINDPTTAVAVLDAEQYLLSFLAGRDLSRPIHRSPRVELILPTWEAYVEIACTEIRLFASTSISVLRRMRALLDQLGAQVRPEGRAVLSRQLALLTRAAEALHAPEDRAMGEVGDPKGLG